LISKKITIVLVPEDSAKVTQFRFPRIFLVFFVLVVLTCTVSLIWIIRDYHAVKVQMPKLAMLEKKNEGQKKQLTLLSERINGISEKMDELKNFDNKLKIMANVDEGETQGQFIGVGGSDPGPKLSDESVAENLKELVLVMHQSLDELNEEIVVEKNVKIELYQFLENQKNLLASTPSIWPTKGWLSSRFGYRISPFTGGREFHKGMDISTRLNTPVAAPSDGIVVRVGRNGGFGKMITIQHGYGLVTKYAHLEKILVKKGQTVKRGDKIGLVGNTGRSTGTHLHYEVHLNGVPVNPARYLSGLPKHTPS